MPEDRPDDRAEADSGDGSRRENLTHDQPQESPEREEAGIEVMPGQDTAPPSLRPIEPSFPVVGIGASAGGLEALEEFFTHVPHDSGMAYIVVQHMAPPHPSALVELLSRYASIGVVEATDGVRVEPNRVYVIPPGRYLSITDGVLHLSSPEGQRSPRNTVDLFFRALAVARREEAIGVILSGSGTDGTLGIRAIKGEAGLVVVQEPSTAQYDGMPTSAIVTGLVDLVLPPAEIPGQIMEYVQTERQAEGVKTGVPTTMDPLRRLLGLVRTHTGVDFSHYKQTTIVRRVQRRMAIKGIANLPEYVRAVQEDPSEVKALFRELLINVTSFFRDPEAFQVLADRILPPLFEGLQPDDVLRVWVPACSTGEEAYSIAIVIQEYLERVGHGTRYHIFATDLDQQAIETARAGVYPDNISVDVSPDRLVRFFHREGNSFRVRKGVRDTLVFAVQNTLQDPPFSRIDLISCRNLLIYLDAEAQNRLLHLFHYSLTDEGVLFLGSSETVGDNAHMFVPLDKKWRFFARRGYAQRRAGFRTGEFSTSPPAPLLSVDRDEEQERPEVGTERREGRDVREVARRALLDAYAPPAVITDELGRIVYFHGRTGKYLEPAPGEPQLNLFSMAREGLAGRLVAVFREAVREQQAVTADGVRVLHEGGHQELEITVRPFRAAGLGKDLFMVAFRDVAPPPDRQPAARSEEADVGVESRVAQLEMELRAARQEVRGVTEELGTANEELQSANEELQSANEELQSSNEELETSQEELQSLNEELQTVNAELRIKIDDLSEANDDMNNLLVSTGIGTLFLDDALRIKRFTPAVSDIIKLIPSDVGRPITDITSNLLYDRLSEDVATVLKTLMPREAQVQIADGRWFAMRLLPYRTMANVIDGVVITFTDVTDLVEERRRARAMREAAQNNADGVLITDAWGQIEYANPKAPEMLGRRPEEIEDGNLADTGWARSDPDSYQRLWNQIKAGRPWQGTVKVPVEAGETRTLEVAASPIPGPEGVPVSAVSIVMRDVSERRREAEEAKRVRAVLAKLAEPEAGAATLILDRQGRIVWADPAAPALLGLGVGRVEGSTEGSVGWRSPEEPSQPLAAVRLPAQRVFSTGESFVDQAYVVVPGEGAQPVALRVSAAPLQDEDGRVDRALVVLERDE